ncbi:MAG: hypothetical protein FWC41_00660 [Firmicutes bacterium]|nr:hypothetical protein [Bacillota bacterium]
MRILYIDSKTALRSGNKVTTVLPQTFYFGNSIDVSISKLSNILLPMLPILQSTGGFEFVF